MSDYKPTSAQLEAQKICAGSAKHVMLFGGSRSGKTFWHVRNIVMRALKAPGSRHAILRHRFNSAKTSIGFDTLPKVMELAFPGCKYSLSKTDWIFTLQNGSEIWLGGLDDKDRTEKILGHEYVTIYLNECSQIGYQSVLTAQTRLAQRVLQLVNVGGNISEQPLTPKMYYDCNPPKKSHWTYKLWFDGVDPVSKQPLPRREDYAWYKLNPADNTDNISDDYIKMLESQPERMRKRFLHGEFADDNPDALFDDLHIEQYRVDEVPQLVRVVVAVDPSGSGDTDNEGNDDIGIIVAGLGQNGDAYVLEDCTIKAGPKTWGAVAVSAYTRHNADRIVAETNFGGEMVKYVLDTVRAHLPFKKVTASRGKIARAEPFSALYESGKVHHVGRFSQLEDEMCGFSTTGFTGGRSPNRADALFWALAELFPAVTGVIAKPPEVHVIPVVHRWG